MKHIGIQRHQTANLKGHLPVAAIIVAGNIMYGYQQTIAKAALA